MYKLDLEKAEEPEIKLPTSVGSSKKQESSRKTSTSGSLTTPKPLTVWITTTFGKFLKSWEYQTSWPASWEICMQVKKQQLEPDMEQWTGSKLGKEYVKAVYIMPNAWLDDSQAGIKITRRSISNFRYADDITLMTESKDETKEPLDKGERGDLKSWLKTQHAKSKDHDLQPHHFMANRWGKLKSVADLIFLGSKITAGGDSSHEIKTFAP